MSSESPSKLRKAKTLSKTPRLSSITVNTPAKTPPMDNSEGTQSTRQDSVTESQRQLQNKVDSLKGEIDGLKFLFERLVQQGEQKNGHPLHRTTTLRNSARGSDTVR